MSKKRKKPPRKPSPGRVVLGTVDGVQVRDHLGEVRRAAADVEAARRSYLEAIEAALDAGCSMGEVGQVLGVSRQAVQQQRATLLRTFGAPAGSSPPKASAWSSHRR